MRNAGRIVEIYGKFCLSERVFLLFQPSFKRFVEPEISVGLKVCRDASEVALFVGSSCRKQKQLKFATWKSLSKILPSKCECSVYCFNGLYRLCRTRDISVCDAKFSITFRRVNGSFDSKHSVFTTCAGFVDRESRYCSLLLFCVREINRFLEIPNRGSRKNSSSVLETRTSILENSILETRALKTRCSILKNFEDRGSSFESRLSTYICPVL